MLYIVDYLPEEIEVLRNRPDVGVGMAELVESEVRDLLMTNEWQNLIHNQKVVENLSLLLEMEIPVAPEERKINFILDMEPPVATEEGKINFKYSDRLIIFLLRETETLVWYNFIYVYMEPVTEAVT